MAHFNPAVTVGFLITRHITKVQVLYYFAAEILGALLGSLFVKFLIGNQAHLGANAPNFAYPVPLIIGVEIFASALLSLHLTSPKNRWFANLGSIMLVTSNITGTSKY